MTDFSWPTVLAPLLAGRDLDEDAARVAMDEIMEGRATPAQIAAFIVMLHAKGETVDEMTGLARSALDHAVTVAVEGPAVDTAGTGGDGSGTFNISTTAALIAAGAGARVAKHGNRAASSRAGSADVLEALGVPLDQEPEEVARSISESGFGFFFAPRYHPAFRHAGPVRGELGVRTVFNFLGPLLNPARATRQAIGVSDWSMAPTMAGVLERLGAEDVFVFAGMDGLDELSIAGPSRVLRLTGGLRTESELDPESLGIVAADSAALAGGDAAENAAIVRRVIAGEPGPPLEAAVLNAAPAIVVAGLAADLVDGVAAARESIASGKAQAVLDHVAGPGKE